MEAIFQGLFELICHTVFDFVAGLLKISCDFTLNVFQDRFAKSDISFSDEIISLNIFNQK